MRDISSLDTDYQDFKYKELTEKIINIFYKVYNKLRYGFTETVYKDAMMIEFKKEGIPSISQSGIRIFYKGEIIDEHYADILVDNKVIVKIKATKDVVEDNEEQLMHCLKAANMGAGVLLNFGTKPEVKLMYL